MYSNWSFCRFFSYICRGYVILLVDIMIKQTIILFLYFLISNCMHLYAQETLAGKSDLTHIYELASKNFIFSSAIPEDSIIQLAIQLESEALKKKDYNTYFKIAQIKVNAYCLKGDIGLATNEAKNLYERAKILKLNLGISLSLQAIGNTYMHSEQPIQALATFKEAEKILNKVNDNSLRIKLYLQIVHACWPLKDMSNMRLYLGKLSNALPNSSIVSREHYEYYTLCYKALYLIETNNMESAAQVLAQIKYLRAVVSNTFYNRCYYWVASYYYDFKEDYEQALLFTDSALVETRLAENLNEYRNSMLEKATLLEKMHEITKACEIYQEMRVLTDSLDVQRYTRQIEHLHTSYLVDQLEVENKEMHSTLLTWIILSCTVILFGGIIVYLMVRRKNKMLVQSRDKLQTLREETTRSIHSKSMFLSNMSHELRTPLNAIVGFSGILTTCSEIDVETKQQCGESIKQNADLLLKLVKDVMDFSEFNINEIRYNCTVYNAVNICRMVVDTVDKVKQTSAQVKFVTSLNELSLYTDSGRLQQVLINLLINATKFTKEGTITLYLAEDIQKNEAVFTVEDTGCGIPLEKQPHIFKRFEKLHEGVQGSGLGLSICQLIVEHFGGKIEIDSSYTEGARFVFTHPLPTIQASSL